MWRSGFGTVARTARPGVGHVRSGSSIETIQPTGADWIVGVNIFGKSIFLISSDPPIGKENDKIGIFFKPEGCHSFDNKNIKILKN